MSAETRDKALAEADVASQTVQNTRQIAAGIRARHLATPLADVMTLATTGDSAAAYRDLTRRQFDHAPVVDEVGRVAGVVAVGDLKEGTSVGSCAAGLHECAVVSADTGLPDVLMFLQDDPFLLVLEGRNVAAILTPADLGRPASRTYFYLLLAQLEIALAALIRQDYPIQQVALAELTETRRRQVLELLARLRKSDELIDEVAALSLSDLLRIAAANPHYKASFTSAPRSWHQQTLELGRFRNDVMHPVRDFREASPVGMRRLLEQVRRLEHLTNASLSFLRATATPGKG